MKIEEIVEYKNLTEPKIKPPIVTDELFILYQTKAGPKSDIQL
jgi:hypothetical protein